MRKTMEKIMQMTDPRAEVRTYMCKERERHFNDNRRGVPGR